MGVRPRISRLTLFVTLAAGAAVLAAPAVPNDEKTITHVLNRVGFGPRDGDVERVRAMGVERYIEQQLHPDKIADDGMKDRLSRLPTLTMSSREIGEKFAQPALEAQRARRQQAANAPNGEPPAQMPRDPAQQQ